MSESESEPSPPNTGAEPGPSLPPADPPAGEVTDEWAAKSQPDGQGETPPVKTTPERGPQRRALPQVQRETEDADKPGERR